MVLNSKKAEKRAARGLPEPPLCKAHKKDGSPCQRAPSSGSTVCRSHGAGAPQVKEAARNRLAMAADGLMQTLLQIAASAESEAVRLAAVKDALDRAGFSATHLVKLAAVQPWEEFLGDIVDDDLFEDVPQTRTRRNQQQARLTDIPFPGGVSEEDTTEEDNATAVQYAIDDDDDTRTTYNIKPTVRSTVTYPEQTPEQRAQAAETERRVRTALFDTYIQAGPDDRPSEFGAQRSSRPATDPNRPPQYVVEAMEADGEDWQEGSGGGSRRATFSR